MIEILKRWVWSIVLAAAVINGCGTGDDNDDIIPLMTEFEVERVEPGLTSAVSIDSVFWQPLTFGITGSGELDIDGDYRIHFRNSAERDIELRYDLRFLDEEGFLIDNFIPFGLPVLLSARSVHMESGEFLIRSGEIRTIYEVVTMRIVARLDTVAALSDP